MFITSNFNLLALHVLKLLNAFCLLLAFDAAKYENEATNACVDITSDVVGREEKLVMGSYEQQISRDPLQDSQAQSKHPHYIVSSQQHVNNTGSVARAVDNTGYNDRPKRYLHHMYI